MRPFGLGASVIAFILFSFTLTSYAEQKIKSEAKQISRAHVSEFIQWQNTVGRFEKMAPQDISAHFANQFEYYTNGKLGATNAASLHQRYKIAQNYYKSAYIHFPVRDIHIEGKKAAAKYRVTFIDKNNMHQDTINTVVIIFNKNGKVVKFSQSFDRGAPLPT
ncbi:MAG: hypothetical protein H0W64_11220 [Gammaproteobacteria bacterium]|nr:hypothetical protein [Gammaproteobacteria bacterium]